MSTVLNTRIWNNITVTEEIDCSTGKMTLRNGAGTLLSTSNPVDWVINDTATFTRNYNSLNMNDNKSEEEFTQFFYSDGVPVFNKDRASAINSQDSFSTPEEYQINTSSLYELGVPGVKNPKTGLNVNSRGNFTTFSLEGQTPRTNNLRSDDGNVAGTREVPNSFILSTGGTSARSLPASVSGLMRYPSSQFSDGDSDTVTITGHEYKAPDAGAGYKDLVAGDRLGASTGTVVLPMHPGLSETSTVDWGGDKLNAVQAAAASAAGGLIGAAAKALGGNFAGGGDDAKGTVSRLAADAKELANSPGAIPYVKAYFAGKAVGSNIATRATGQVINPNLELLFQGPMLRTFNFNFNLTPRDEGESQTIKNMIRFFKKNMNPFVEEGKLFLYTPNIFKIEYQFQGGEHPFLNKIKPCALQNFSVDYTPEGAYSTYGDGGMTRYTLQLTFGELTPIYQNEQDAAGGTGF